MHMNTKSLNRTLSKRANTNPPEHNTVNNMRNLFNEINGIKPDHEQRLLAIEVSTSPTFILYYY